MLPRLYGGTLFTSQGITSLVSGTAASEIATNLANIALSTEMPADHVAQDILTIIMRASTVVTVDVNAFLPACKAAFATDYTPYFDQVALWVAYYKGDVGDKLASYLATYGEDKDYLSIKMLTLIDQSAGTLDLAAILDLSGKLETLLAGGATSA